MEFGIGQAVIAKQNVNGLIAGATYGIQKITRRNGVMLSAVVTRIPAMNWKDVQDDERETFDQTELKISDPLSVFIPA